MSNKLNTEISLTAILDELTSHPIRWALLFLFIILLVLALLLTVVPVLIVNSSNQYYNDSNLAGMHATVSSNLIIAFVSALSALFTLIYVILTRKLVLENRRITELQTIPNVFLFIEPRNEHNDITDLFIQNIGMGAAFNIKLTVLSDFIFSKSDEDKDGNPLGKTEYHRASDALIIKNEIKYLAPTQKKRLFSTSFNAFKEINIQNNLNNILKINVEYDDYLGRKKEGTFTLNFYEVPANGMDMLTTFEGDHIEKLKEIKEAIHSITGEIKNLECTSDE